MPSWALAIETSNPALGSEVVVALLDRRDQRAVQRLFRESVRSLHDDPVQAAARACEQAGCVAKDLSHIAVSIGPGGFTSVRIAVTAARMLAEVTGAALIGVPSAAVAARAWAMQQQLQHAHQQRAIVLVALTSKGDSAYVEAHEVAQDSVAPFATSTFAAGAVHTAHTFAPALASVVALAQQQSISVVLLADQFLPAPLQEVAANHGVNIAPPQLSAEACLHASFAIAPCEPMTLAPVYPREPEAVTKWRAMKRT